MTTISEAAPCREQAAYIDGRALPAEALHTMRLPGRSGGEADIVTIRVAHSGCHRNLANELVNRRYSWRGYGSDHRLAAGPQSVTFTASSDEEVIGTLTLTVDSPAGLAIDNAFSDDLAGFRTPGAHLCELTKFAIDSPEPSKHVLAALFHTVFLYGSHRYNCTDLFVEVNPRHRRFYETMLGFRRVGSLKSNVSVGGAPSQLMWLSVSNVRRQIDENAGHDRVARRSLYPHFLSANDECGIYSRLNQAAYALA
jgi:hypothetical protein